MDCGHHQTVNKLTNDTTKPYTINLLHANAFEKLPSTSDKLIICNHFPSIISHVCHFRPAQLTRHRDVWGLRSYCIIFRRQAMDALLRLLGGSIMVRLLLAVLTVLVMYGIGKVVAHFWKMHRAFRGLPRHPNKHWFYGHAELVCYVYNGHVSPYKECSY